MKNKHLHAVLMLIAGTLISLCIAGCAHSIGESKKYQFDEGEIFHTYYHIKYRSETNYHNNLKNVFKEFNHSLNPFDSTSIVTAINRNKSMYTDYMFRTVYNRAINISEATQGTYDVTCSPIINLWGFGFDKASTPTDKAIDSLKVFVGYKKTHLSGDCFVKEDSRILLDFSSISKGYCTDLLGHMLKSKGINDYMVELGGEIVFEGVNPDGKPWHIGINKPIEDSTGMVQDLQLIVQLKGKGGLATSGNYRNFHIIDGKKVGHTIDPLAGRPIQTDILSATVIAEDCMTADGLATAFMAAGSQRVKSIASQFNNIEYLLIISGDKGGYTTVMSDGFKKLIVEN
ncbi:FAD:protein FMN transferase [Porphyromonas pogonae]|uniref:FAD:protein FMN transferase n=1 Tax=Porphyromonas pogonae TaxID=867595 RepID=UPI002E784064|nr:FAD:protein FMN transferase [Porphyromonas pogonae]